MNNYQLWALPLIFPSFLPFFFLKMSLLSSFATHRRSGDRLFPTIIYLLHFYFPVFIFSPNPLNFIFLFYTATFRNCPILLFPVNFWTKFIRGVNGPRKNTLSKINLFYFLFPLSSFFFSSSFFKQGRGVYPLRHPLCIQLCKLLGYQTRTPLCLTKGLEE